MAGYVSDQNPALGGDPIALAPSTYERHANAVRWVEQQGRVRTPLARRGPGAGLAVGWWGFLADGATITGSSGMTLGSGTVTLCSRSGATLTADGESITVYNAGGSVTAGTGGRILKLGWTDGAFSLDVFPCS